MHASPLCVRSRRVLPGPAAHGELCSARPIKKSPSCFGPEPRLRATAAVAATVVVVAAMAGCGRCWCRLAQRGSSCFSTRALPSRCGRCLQRLESAMHIVQRLAMLAMVVAVASAAPPLHNGRGGPGAAVPAWDHFIARAGTEGEAYRRCSEGTGE